MRRYWPLSEEMLNSVKNRHINVQTLAKKVNVKNSTARFSVLGCVSVAKYEDFPPDLRQSR